MCIATVRQLLKDLWRTGISTARYTMRKNLLPFVVMILVCSNILSCVKTLPTQEAPTSVSEKKPPLRMPAQKTDLSGYNIISMQTYESPGHRFWLITYLDANNLQKTIVIETNFYANNYEETKTYRCEGSSCDCRVEIYESLPGEYSVRCACTPCTLIIE
jgi:hypothetical protein